jgi:hypothetical protein
MVGGLVQSTLGGGDVALLLVFTRSGPPYPLNACTHHPYISQILCLRIRPSQALSPPRTSVPSRPPLNGPLQACEGPSRPRSARHPTRQTRLAGATHPENSHLLWWGGNFSQVLRVIRAKFQFLWPRPLAF